MQRHFYRFLICAIAGSLLLGASGPIPEIVNHPQPDLEVDMTRFLRSGCSIGENDELNCEWEGPIADLGCTKVSKPSDLLGGLKPAFPLAVCRQTIMRSQPQPTPRDYFYRSGGLLPVYIRYIVYKDGKFQIIRNPDEFKRIFAPIQSEEEALSYALAVKNLRAFYGQRVNPNYQYFVDKIEDTRVVKKRDGYAINLYDKRIFGCGPRPTSVVNILVTPEGNIREVSRKEVFKDPQEDNLCVD